MDENQRTARRLTGALVLVVVGGIISLSVALVVAWDLAFGEGSDGRWWTLLASGGTAVAAICNWFYFGAMRKRLLSSHDTTTDDLA